MKGGLIIFLAVLGAIAIVSAVFVERYRLIEENTFLAHRARIMESENERLRALIEDNAARERKVSNARIRGDMERAVERIRGLKFLHPVDYNELGRDELRGVVLRLVEEQISDAEFANATAALVNMGFLPHDADLKTSLVDLLSEQIAAFYDQRRHKLFMFRGSDLRRADQRIILAHELTHALQDQHFALRKMPLELKDNDDKVAATQALIEGDATLVMSLYALEEFSGKNIGEMASMMFAQPIQKLLRAPRYLRESLVFPYLGGQEFVTRLHERGGFEAINAAFRQPPTSTAQIFDLEKFLSQPRVEPVMISWPDDETNGKRRLVENTAGELGVRLLFKEWLGPELSEQIARGWAGDRYRAYRVSDSGSKNVLSTVWRIVWENPQEAQEYMGGCEQLLLKRYKPEPGKVKRDARRCDFDAPRVVRLRKISEVETALIEACSVEWADTMAQRLSSPSER